MAHDPRPMADTKLNRRRMLVATGGVLSGGALLAATTPLWSAGGEAPPSSSEFSKQVKGYRRFYVVPASLDKFTVERRIELSVLGPQQGALNCSNKQCRAPGFMAWLEPLAAGKLALEKDVKTVYELTADDVPMLGSVKDSKGQFTVMIAPNGWSAGPKENTFLSVVELAKQWEENLKKFATATVTPPDPPAVPQPNGPPPAALPPGEVAQIAGDDKPGWGVAVSVSVQFEDPEVPEAAVKYLRAHPQTNQIVIHPIQPGGGFFVNCPACGGG